MYVANRNIEDLEENFKKKLINFLVEMRNLGEEMKPHETLRSAERQAYLVSTGKSKVYRSNHQDGVAADLHFIKTPNFPPSGSQRWKTAATIAKKHGIDCGGILWNGWDWNHFQDDGSTTQDLVKNWMEEAQAWAMKNKISNGERPQDDITRVEVWETLRKFSKNYLKR